MLRKLLQLSANFFKSVNMFSPSITRQLNIEILLTVILNDIHVVSI